MKKLKIVKRYDNTLNLLNTIHTIYYKNNNFYFLTRYSDFKIEELFKHIELDYEIILEFKEPIDSIFCILKDLNTNKYIALKETLSMNRFLDKLELTNELKYNLMLEANIKDKLKLRLLGEIK